MEKERQLLLVDDDAFVRDALGRTLKELGFLVTVCGSGHEALENAGSAGCDVLVTDFEMPGMMGTELVSTMRRLFPRVFIVGMSGYDVSGEFLGAGADHFLRKPVQTETLRSVLASVPGSNS